MKEAPNQYEHLANHIHEMFKFFETGKHTKNKNAVWEGIKYNTQQDPYYYPTIDELLKLRGESTM